jgi:hypothetical protein
VLVTDRPSACLTKLSYPSKDTGGCNYTDYYELRVSFGESAVLTEPRLECLVTGNLSRTGGIDTLSFSCRGLVCRKDLSNVKGLWVFEWVVGETAC